MSIEQVNKIAQGRVWTGEQAVQNKLVDRIGGIDAAIAEAKSLAKLKPDETVGIVELPEPESTISRLLSGQIYGSAVTQPIPSAALKRLLWITNQSLSGRSLTGQAYCPLVPVM